jgi:hypothetical protein
MLLAVAATASAVPPDETAMRRDYENLVQTLDHKRIARDYPQAVEHLDSSEPQVQIAGLQTLAATGEVEAIPWIVPLIDSADSRVRIIAGLSLSRIVASHELKRRDMTRPETVVIKPPGPGDLDLKPLAWVIVRMLRKPDDGNTYAYAANMIGYLRLAELETSLWQLHKSRHPAVTRAAGNALKMLGHERPTAFSESELAAAQSTGETFAKLFRSRDEDGLGLLLVPQADLPSVLSPRILDGKDIDSLYVKFVSGTTQRFIEFRDMCGDMSKLSAVSFQPGYLVESESHAADVRVMRNSFVVFAYANRVEIKVKIEDMVFVDGKCYILAID